MIIKCNTDFKSNTNLLGVFIIAIFLQMAIINMIQMFFLSVDASLQPNNNKT